MRGDGTVQQALFRVMALIELRLPQLWHAGVGAVALRSGQQG